MAIFNSYVKLPEGNCWDFSATVGFFRSKLQHLTPERRNLAQRLCDGYAEALSEEGARLGEKGGCWGMDHPKLRWYPLVMTNIAIENGHL